MQLIISPGGWKQHQLRIVPMRLHIFESFCILLPGFWLPTQRDSLRYGEEGFVNLVPTQILPGQKANLALSMLHW
uniref:Uncharacterized protein n=1 Tax=Picea glauca TaxID=3330 RepID=A0A101M309_PICGL|nr:hypothetical protein ABT39_MTgene3359 [Picea glauca]QHR89123.1 hypothetical protein Q903MT_gene3142 [Picea sitchensis]